MSSHWMLRITLRIIFLVVLIIAGYLFYLYQKGGVEHYRPPVTKTESSSAQVLRDLTTLSQAVNAYYAKNLRYPEKLDQLQPEFIDQIPSEPKTGRPFIYESDGKDQYQIGISNPVSYGFQELFAKNGKIYQK